MAHLRKYGIFGHDRPALQETLEEMLENGIPAHKLAEFLLDYFYEDDHIHLVLVGESPCECQGLYEGLLVTEGKKRSE